MENLFISSKHTIIMNKPVSHQRVALQRINELLVQASDAFSEYPDMSRRYVLIARKMAMKYKVRFTKDQKRLFCKKCNAYLQQGNNCSVRLEHGRIVITCKECGSIRRIIYKK